jgi:hypothetical protein
MSDRETVRAQIMRRPVRPAVSENAEGARAAHFQRESFSAALADCNDC